jgi:hypothetical protein
MIDDEVNKLLSEGEELVNMTQSKGWAIAEKILLAKIEDLQRIQNIKATDAAAVVAEMQARIMAVDSLWEFINEVKNRVENHTTAKQAEMTQPDQGFIERT